MKENKQIYRSVPNAELRLEDCKKVSYYEFSGHIESTASTYVRPFKTKAELKAELKYLKKQPYAVMREGAEIHKKIILLQKALITRKQVHPKKVRKATTREENHETIKRSQRKVLHYIYNNFDVPFVLCATFTYATKEYCYENVCKDFTNLRKKLKYRFPKIAFIAVYEPCEDTSWHVHTLLRGCKGFKKELLETLWGKGNVHVEIFKVKAAPYFCKNDRLEMYPAGARLYTKSRNVLPPIKHTTSVENFKKKIAGLPCTYESGKKLVVEVNGEEKVLNNFLYQNFMKREV